jgi:hypothetical protein
MIDQIIRKYKESLREDSTSNLRVISEILLQNSGPATRTYLYANQSGCKFTTYILFTMIYFKCENPKIKPFISFVKQLFHKDNPMSNIIQDGLQRNQYTEFPSRLCKNDTLTIVQILRSVYELGYNYTPKHTFLIYKDKTKKINNYTVFSSWNPPLIPLIVTPNQSFTQLNDFLDNMYAYTDYQKILFGIDEPIGDGLKIVCFTDKYIKQNLNLLMYVNVISPEKTRQITGRYDLGQDHDIEILHR